MSWVAAELPPDIPAACVVQAAEHYNLPVIALVSILKQENGQVGKVYPRSHGTYYGPAQISDKWLPQFAQWQITADKLQYDACINVAAGAYILAYYKVREEKWVDAIARYNVGSLNRPDQVNAGRRYAEKVLGHWKQIYARWGAR